VPYGHAAYAAEEGLRRVERTGAHIWLRASTSLTLVAGTYSYALASDVFRLRKDSFRYGGFESYLKWIDNAEEIDRILGPDWKDSATANGTPLYVSRLGNAVWVAPKASQAFIDDSTTSGALNYYYLRHEPVAGTLYIPDTFFACAVHAALAEGLKQKDEKLQAYYENLFERVDKTDLIGTPLAVGSSAKLRGSELAEDLDYEKGYA